MADFWSMFSSKPAAGPAPAQQQQSTGNNQQNNQQSSQQNEPGNRPPNGATLPGANSGNPGDPNNTNTQQQGAKSPLDVYSKMFDNKGTTGDGPPAFVLDPKTLDGIVKDLDFTKGIDPAVMTRATQGDSAALMEIIQGVSRNSYKAAIEHGGVLTDKFVGAREAHSSKGFSGKVRQELVTNQLASNTPSFQHPVVRQQLTEIAQRLQAQNPDATAKEIGDMSVKYLQDLVDAIRQPEDKQKQSTQQQTGERGEEFWNDYFEQGEQPAN